MKSYFATYKPTPASEPIDATVLVFDKNLNIGYRELDGSNTTINWLLKDVEASFDFGRQQSRLKNLKFNGPELTIAGNDAAHFIQGRQAEFKKAWHKKSGGKEWIRNSFLMLLILGCLFLLYLLIVPWLSEKLAGKVSIKTEKQLGDAVYDALQLRQREDTIKTVILNDFFKKMNVPTGYDIRISVIKDDIVNAFALPGGRIVVYSALLDEITTYPELAALLSHEFTHINNKHSTKSIFRQLGSKVFLGLLFGKFGTVTTVVVNNADNLRSLKYSRRLEKEADTEGLALLMRRQIDPAGFEDLFEHLEKAGPANNLPEFLGSHPDVQKRIEYIREAAKAATVKDNIELSAIFDEIK